MNAQPGPWTRDKYGHVRDANGEQVCLHDFALCGGITPKGDSSFANTAVCVAAPDLLKACKEIDTFFVFFDSHIPPDIGAGARAALMNVKAAIRKATP